MRTPIQIKADLSDMRAQLADARKAHKLAMRSGDYCAADEASDDILSCEAAIAKLSEELAIVAPASRLNGPVVSKRRAP